MAAYLQKYEQLNEAQLQSMIAYTQRSFPFLEFTSVDTLLFLSQLMINVEFMHDKKATPIRSSLEFLRTTGEGTRQRLIAAGRPDFKMFVERDFIFAIKMFGLHMRNHNGIIQFLPENVVDRTDEIVTVDSNKDAKELEYYVSDIHKRTKIQTQAIESASNRLLREWREIELARIFSEKMREPNVSIGEAKKFLEEQCDIKSHEFVRIREHAIERGWYVSKRRTSESNRRVTLDEDVALIVEGFTRSLATGTKVLSMSQAVNKALRGRVVSLDEDVGAFVEELTTTLASGTKELTMSQAVNKALRDFHMMTRSEALSKPPGTAKTKAKRKTKARVAA